MAAWVNTVAAITPMQVAVLSEVRGRDHSFSAGAPPTEEIENCDKMGTPSSYRGAPAAAGAPLVGHQQQLLGDEAEKTE